MPPDLSSAFERMRGAASLVLLLDYDGTLTSFTAIPDEARPDAELLKLLADLAARPSTFVHIVSGRSRAILEEWLGTLAVGLHAEHAFWSRMDADATWEASHALPTGWKAPILAVFEGAAARAPGAIVEEKASCIAWHFRNVEHDAGLREASELTLRLGDLLAASDLELLVGDMVLEVRLRGVHKGHAVVRVESAHPGSLLVAMGDDRTDEDLFAALPPDGIAIHVGVKTTRAALRVPSPADVRGLLRALVGPERPSQTVVNSDDSPSTP